MANSKSGGDPALEKLGRRLQAQTKTAREKEAAETRSQHGMSGQLMKLKSFKRGGKVKRTGPHMLHKGEKVVPVHKAKKRPR